MKPKSICFIANFYKTFFYRELAKGLEHRGVRVFWVVTNAKQAEFLEDEYGKEKILYIHRGFFKRPGPLVGDFHINELVYGDRVLKHEIANGLKFLTNIQLPVYEFIKKNGISVVFGEITWAHELLINRICTRMSELGCAYFDSSVVRIPNGRIGFFSGENQGTLVEFNRQLQTGDTFTFEKPVYLHINDRFVKRSKSLKGRMNRLKRFFTGENIDPLDPTVIVNKAVRARVMGTEEINRASYSRLTRRSWEEIKGSKYLFYGFHKQPEASIDVSGRYHEDQSAIVKNLWRMLPAGWNLVVKEHTNAIGDRSVAFYRHLLRFPGIVLAHEKIDSRRLIEESSLVVAVTGTIAYEAALLGKPAVTMAPVFFNRLNFCRRMTMSDLTQCGGLDVLADSIRSQPDNREDYKDWLLRNTFRGYVTDHVSDPSVMQEENVQLVTDAFYELIKSR